MLDLLNYLHSNSKEIYLNTYDCLIVASLQDIDIVIEFSKEEIEDWDEFLDSFDSSYYFLTKDDLPRVSNYTIKNVSVCSFDYLGDREYINIDTPIDSLTIKMFNYVKLIKEHFNDAIAQYHISTNEGYGNAGGMCAGEPNFGFTILINPKYYLDLKLYNQLILIPNNYKESKTPIFYNFFIKDYFKHKEGIQDSKEIHILITNTKARRLGYLKILSSFLKINKKIPTSTINKKYELFSQDYSKDLENYKNNKGVIKVTKTGISAKPYVDLAKDLKLINYLNNIYSLSKGFKTYSILKDEYSSETNPFYLSLFDKTYFLQLILKKDFIYTSTLLEFIYISEKTDYHILSKHFQAQLLEKISLLKMAFSHEKVRTFFNNVKNIEDRIIAWEDPNKYLEHVLMPRLNWLFDLEIISLDPSLNVSLTESGLKLFRNICIWHDINSNYVINPDHIIDKFDTYMFNDIYNSKDIKVKSNDEIINIAERYLIESFNYFQTLAPNRVTMSQAIDYTKYKSYLENGVLISSDQIKSFLTENKFPNLICKYQRQYRDGYIQLKKTMDHE